MPLSRQDRLIDGRYIGSPLTGLTVLYLGLQVARVNTGLTAVLIALGAFLVAAGAAYVVWRTWNN